MQFVASFDALGRSVRSSAVASQFFHLAILVPTRGLNPIHAVRMSQIARIRERAPALVALKRALVA
jgi:hypothetical protein